MSLSAAAAAAVDFVAGEVTAAQPFIVQASCVCFARWRHGGVESSISIQGN